MERDALCAPPAIPKRPPQERKSLSPSPPRPLNSDLRPSNSDSDHRPVSALSEEDIKLQENGELSSEDEAFDKKKSSGATVPCPYIDFVPLKGDDEPSSRGKGKSKESSNGVDAAADKKEAESATNVESSAGGGDKEGDDEVSLEEVVPSAKEEATKEG